MLAECYWLFVTAPRWLHRNLCSYQSKPQNTEEINRSVIHLQGQWYYKRHTELIIINPANLKTHWSSALLVHQGREINVTKEMNLWQFKDLQLSFCLPEADVSESRLKKKELEVIIRLFIIRRNLQHFTVW